MERNQGKDETLQGTALSTRVRAWKSKSRKKNLPSSLVRDNRKREDLPDLRCLECRLANRSLRSVHVHYNNRSVIHGAIGGNVWYPYFKSNVIVANTDLELLLSNNVLFWPIRVILPLLWRRSVYARTALSVVCALCDFARLYDPLELLHDQWTNPH